MLRVTFSTPNTQCKLNGFHFIRMKLGGVCFSILRMYEHESIFTLVCAHFLIYFVVQEVQVGIFLKRRGVLTKFGQGGDYSSNGVEGCSTRLQTVLCTEANTTK